MTLTPGGLIMCGLAPNGSITHISAPSLSEGALIWVIEPFGAKPHIIKPPGVRVIEPLQERRIIQFISRHVGIIEERADLLFTESLSGILHQGRDFGESPKHGIICCHAYFPLLELYTEIGFAGEGEGDRSEFESPQYT